MLNFAWERLSHPAFPGLSAVIPADVCRGYSGPVSVTPASGSFPPPDALGGIFPTIDHAAAKVLSWTASAIVLSVPAGLTPGCHGVGWGYLMDPDAVAQLNAIR
jgi:hypothetical protein